MNLIPGKISKKVIRDRKGLVLPVVMALVALMTLSTISLATMIRQNVELVRSAKFGSQARYVAEAGIMHAFARFKNESFNSRSNFTGNLDTGSYSVTFSTTLGRYLITSVGTVGDVSRTVSAEVEDLTPSSMYCICSADNDIRIYALVANASINGDVHANHNVYFYADPLLSNLSVTGDVSATGVVQEGARLHVTDGWSGLWLDSHVYINGVDDDNGIVTETADRKRLPTFDYDAYQEAAEDSGNYYSTSQTFNNLTLSPGNGIVFVNGTATFTGTCTINGGIVANTILVVGTLNQNRSGTKNVVISRVGDIGILGRLNTQEAVVFAGRDLIALQAGANIDVNGVMLAKRDISMWNLLTYIDYNYIATTPSDMGDEDAQLFGIISWNR